MKSKLIVLRLPSLLVLASLFIFPVGCGRENTIVGRWQRTINTPSGSSATTTIEFTPDGRELITGQSTSRGITAGDSASGTYTVSGTNLTQNLTTLTRDGKRTPLPPDLIRTGPFVLDGQHLTLVDPSSSGTPRTTTLARE